jgi:hypothetical protein
MLRTLPFQGYAPELPDVVCGNARPGGAGADRHAAFVCHARQLGDRAGGFVGRPGNRDADAGIAGRGICDHAIRRLSLPPRHALWRARESCGDAGGLGAGDAGGAARAHCDAVRFRRLLLVADGDRHRLDDRGHAMGRGAAGSHRADGCVRDRPADRGERRHHPDGAVTHAAALVGCCRTRARLGLGRCSAAARYPDLRRRAQRRRPRARMDACI